MDNFVHLHNHTDYSMLDGAATIERLLARAVELGQPAVAMTDHATMSGAYNFWQRSVALNIEPIIGMEANLAPGSRLDRNRDPILGAYTHITLLARTPEGLRNLFRLASEASKTGYYYKPRIDLELLAAASSGLVATTGCLGGATNQYLLREMESEAEAHLGSLQDIFNGDLYYEVMEHGVRDEHRIQAAQRSLARSFRVPLLATNDCHYVTSEEANIHAALLCVQTGSTLAAPALSFEGGGYFLKSRAEMGSLGLPEEALNNTLLLASTVESYDSVFAYKDRMPSLPNADAELNQWATVALIEMSLDSHEYRERLDYELALIQRLGYSSYFLVVGDIIAEAKRRGIGIGPGRGSAAGSLVAYSTGITGLDPIRFGLMFERFLNPDRVSPPDIDFDIDDERRPELVAYAIEKYGADYVAQISTFGTIKTRASIKDAARVLGFAPNASDALVNRLPKPVFGQDLPLRSAIGVLRPTAAEQPIVDLALGLEGIKRSVGVHAAGVIISSEPLVDVIPVWRRDDGAIITGFDMVETEKMGLLKIDFLGLKNLSTIRHALDNVKRSRGIDVDLESLPLDDQETYALLASGHALGVFQLDSPGMRGLLRILQPTEFLDISACIALYRPGPMGVNAHVDFAKRKSGSQAVERIHPELDLEEILDETYGLIVYQEQVMAIAQKVAGYSLSQADLLRRAMGKKKKEILDAELEGFAAGMRDRGYSRGAIQTLWDTLVPFADYAFNKAHSAGYGLVSYWTAYLKAHYPAEYMAALLTSVKDDADKLSEYLRECDRMGITILHADVNESHVDFSAYSDTRIRYGLSAIPGLGVSSMEALIQTRGEGFPSFPGFLRKAPQILLNKRVLDALISANAFDSLGLNAERLLETYQPYMAQELERKKNAALGDLPLFVRTIGMHITGLDNPCVIAESLGAISYLAAFPGPCRLLFRSAGGLVLDTEVTVDASALDGIDIEAWLA